MCNALPLLASFIRKPTNSLWLSQMMFLCLYDLCLCRSWTAFQTFLIPVEGFLILDLFFPADILICHSGESTGVAYHSCQNHSSLLSAIPICPPPFSLSVKCKYYFKHLQKFAKWSTKMLKIDTKWWLFITITTKFNKIL